MCLARRKSDYWAGVIYELGYERLVEREGGEGRGDGEGVGGREGEREDNEENPMQFEKVGQEVSYDVHGGEINRSRCAP